ncbi:GDP-mannose 4,6-dehydratase [Pseudomonas sp. Fl4BN1]|uniref:GDP-mannose 4,6-dehydratase n=1 Tax=Pseudomonas sp. Fl4BN1 TaxID=2697651 RepID=UPI00137727D1|nr:GDP-mannose 4,6-dehydratase [Pseudomonas sp. Fl4BN1]NBF09255.1 NAD-dependent epimerase/dehydratase family protein [Pseudomonas sp. Fl4BN1]
MDYSEKTALICGVSGQDGAYLAKLLLDKGYTVWGTSRDVQGSSLGNLKRLDILSRVNLLSMVPEDFRSVFMALKSSQPDEVYFLAGQSSVGLSFELPAETIQSITLGTLNMLEACRMSERPIRFYQAGSSECFGDTKGEPASEVTPFHPRSPYAVAKSSAFWLVDNYREAYNLFACTGILFNHESPIRPLRFVTQKIVTTAKRIASGSDERLTLGRLDIARDWGAAAEYVDAMWRMLQCEQPSDFVIATGKTHTLEAFVSEAFTQLGLDWRQHVDQSEAFFRPTDLLVSRADPSKAEQVLGWRAKATMPDVIASMLSAD